MKRQRQFWVMILMLFCISSPVSAKERVLVFAASSMTNALMDIGRQFDRQHDSEIVFSFASSSALARQIAYGAPADLYLSANQEWMDYLAGKQAVVADSTVVLLSNQLVLVSPKVNSSAAVTLNSDWDLVAAIGDSRLAIADPDHVPAGRYAKQSLEHLGLWNKASSHLAQSANVRAALALVERGESPYGIVYQTDAKVSDNVRVAATFPPDSHSPILYPLALVKRDTSEMTLTFYRYLQGPEAAKVFRHYGFEVKTHSVGEE
ncbi:molybdate ABC transporter substrate-binding protein [Veronia pacifica]|uniref:Molybdate ABC transporter substrate-binding protein n=1 Tax=Veronia pacifica TaxID=1080227 RepID=A0A1C3E6B9_9GAMM|nr:molybdate ABC transporter substrate-binding protein [Veronia pacifica]